MFSQYCLSQRRDVSFALPCTPPTHTHWKGPLTDPRGSICLHTFCFWLDCPFRYAPSILIGPPAGGHNVSMGVRFAVWKLLCTLSCVCGREGESRRNSIPARSSNSSAAPPSPPPNPNWRTWEPHRSCKTGRGRCVYKMCTMLLTLGSLGYHSLGVVSWWVGGRMPKPPVSDASCTSNCVVSTEYQTVTNKHCEICVHVYLLGHGECLATRFYSIRIHRLVIQTLQNLQVQRQIYIWRCNQNLA